MAGAAGRNWIWQAVCGGIAASMLAAAVAGAVSEPSGRPASKASAQTFVPAQPNSAPGALRAATRAGATTNGALGRTGGLAHAQATHPEQISFREPVDFPTAANPSSEEFNRAEGDQIGSYIARRMPLSDSVAVGDFNHDGRSDVAQTNVIAGSLSVFLSDGRGGFAPPRLHEVGDRPVHVVAGDLDLDGRLDLAVANMGSHEVAVLRGDGKGGFLPASSVSVPMPRNVAVGQFNGDAIPDLAVASSAPAQVTPFSPPVQTAGGVALVLGNAAGKFVPAQFIATTAGDRPVNANFVAAGDFDGDGRDDLAVGTGISPNAGDAQPGRTELTGDDVLIFRNQGGPLGTAAPFSAAPHQRIRVGAWPAAIAVADLDADTDPDLAVLDAASGDLTTLLGDGAGAFAFRATNTTVGSLPRSLVVADFDDDGRADLVTAGFSSSTVSVLAGKGNGTFEAAMDFWSGDATTGVAVGDFNADSRVDVVAGRLRDDHLALLLNDSPQRGDGVVSERDIPYGSPTHPTNDPFAAHHTLDIYLPPKGTPSFAGSGRPYPVVVWAHGGGGISGDKSMGSYLMRSLAVEGIVAISTDYRLGWDLPIEVKIEDLAHAFRWTRDNVARYGGDPTNMALFGYSAGGVGFATVATTQKYSVEQKSIRALVLASTPVTEPGDAAVLPPSLLLTGDHQGEKDPREGSASFSAAAVARGFESTHIVVAGRDHLTMVSNLARATDPGREPLFAFLAKHLNRERSTPVVEGAPPMSTSGEPRPGPASGGAPALPSTGDTSRAGGLAALVAAFVALRARRRANSPEAAWPLRDRPQSQVSHDRRMGRLY